LDTSSVGRAPEGVAVIAVDLVVAFAGWCAFDVVPAGVFGVVTDHIDVRLVPWCRGDGDVVVGHSMHMCFSIPLRREAGLGLVSPLSQWHTS
jgi:hypothetical protein